MNNWYINSQWKHLYIITLTCPDHMFTSLSFPVFSTLLQSTVLSLSQRFLQTSEFPQSSGGKLLRCHRLSKRQRYREEGDAVTQPRGEKKEMRWKDEKNKEQNWWWYPCTPQHRSSTLYPGSVSQKSSSVYKYCLLYFHFFMISWLLLQEAKGGNRLST